MIPYYTRYALTINDTFKMRYCKKVYIREYQNCNKLKSKVPERPIFVNNSLSIHSQKTYLEGKPIEI